MAEQAIQVQDRVDEFRVPLTHLQHKVSDVQIQQYSVNYDAHMQMRR